MVDRNDPVEELWRERQRRNGGQKAVVAEFAGLDAASSAAPADSTVVNRFAAVTSSVAATRAGRHNSVSLGHQTRRVHHKFGPLAHFLGKKKKINFINNNYNMLYAHMGYYNNGLMTSRARDSINNLKICI